MYVIVTMISIVISCWYGVVWSTGAFPGGPQGSPGWSPLVDTAIIFLSFWLIPMLAGTLLPRGTIYKKLRKEFLRGNIRLENRNIQVGVDSYDHRAQLPGGLMLGVHDWFNLWSLPTRVVVAKIGRDKWNDQAFIPVYQFSMNEISGLPKYVILAWLVQSFKHVHLFFKGQTPEEKEFVELYNQGVEPEPVEPEPKE